MSRKADWDYGDASSVRAGEMRCSACSKPIKSGEFRYRKRAFKDKDGASDWGYVSQHRSCSESDPAWADSDRAKIEREVRQQELDSDAHRFFEKWGHDGAERIVEIADDQYYVSY